MNGDQKIQILYEEYKRLIDRRDAVFDSSLEDFKQISIILPVLYGFLTLSENFQIKSIPEQHKPLTIFAVYLFTMIIVLIMGLRDCLKISVVQYTAELIIKCEEEINKYFDSIGLQTNAFKNEYLWQKKYRQNHNKIYKVLILVSGFVIIMVPTLLLRFIHQQIVFSWVYFTIAITLFTIYNFTVNGMLNRKNLPKINRKITYENEDFGF